ncbi:hypothetical protein DTI93_09220 [Parasaccharibacter sp. TMW 2.1884]|uniref:hypothetical protein n=1 Tax=Parasaccharibacter sp. TMW 2.1884 TaxID=2267834 RepID=UPI0020121907|nr:hypothetical protein [Parasaccharibacter sp. TMW 2.1884]MCL1512561.1 hypothetical protein [Parasaccharibacter sp. TMW 2.1884]
MPATNRRFCLKFARALYPGEVGLEDVLEAAAVFHAWLSGRLDVGLSRAPAASADGEPFELADLRVTVTPRPDGPDDAALARQVRLREQAEAMLEEKARQLRQVKKRFRRMLLLNWFLASFAMASGLLELWLCGWL